MMLATKATAFRPSRPIMSSHNAAQARMGSTSIDGGIWLQNAPTETRADAARTQAVSQGRSRMT